MSELTQHCLYQAWDILNQKLKTLSYQNAWGKSILDNLIFWLTKCLKFKRLVKCRLEWLI